MPRKKLDALLAYIAGRKRHYLWETATVFLGGLIGLYLVVPLLPGTSIVDERYWAVVWLIPVAMAAVPLAIIWWAIHHARIYN